MATGLLAYRELDNTLRLTDTAPICWPTRAPARSRTAKLEHQAAVGIEPQRGSILSPVGSAIAAPVGY